MVSFSWPSLWMAFVYTTLYAIVSRLPMIFAMVYMVYELKLQGAMPAVIFCGYCIARLLAAVGTVRYFGMPAMFAGTFTGVLGYAIILIWPKNGIVFGVMIGLTGFTETVTGIDTFLKIECLIEDYPLESQQLLFRLHLVAATLGSFIAYLGGGIIYESAGVVAICIFGMGVSVLNMIALAVYCCMRSALCSKCFLYANDVLRETETAEHNFIRQLNPDLAAKTTRRTEVMRKTELNTTAVVPAPYPGSAWAVPATVFEEQSDSMENDQDRDCVENPRSASEVSATEAQPGSTKNDQDRECVKNPAGWAVSATVSGDNIKNDRIGSGDSLKNARAVSYTVSGESTKNDRKVSAAGSVGSMKSGRTVAFTDSGDSMKNDRTVSYDQERCTVVGEQDRGSVNGAEDRGTLRSGPSRSLFKSFRTMGTMALQGGGNSRKTVSELLSEVEYSSASKGGKGSLSSQLSMLDLLIANAEQTGDDDEELFGDSVHIAKTRSKKSVFLSSTRDMGTFAGLSRDERRKIRFAMLALVLSFYVTVLPISNNFGVLALYWQAQWQKGTSVSGLIMAGGELGGLIALQVLAHKRVFRLQILRPFRKPVNLIVATLAAGVAVALVTVPLIQLSALGSIGVHVVNVLLHSFCSECAAAWAPHDVYASWIGRCYLSKRLSNATVAAATINLFFMEPLWPARPYVFVASVVSVWSLCLFALFFYLGILPWQQEDPDAVTTILKGDEEDELD